MNPPVLQLEAITKRFPGVLANDRVSFAVAPATVHGLVGENGAGKTTLMRIVYGMYGPDEGQLYVKGEPVRFASPRDSMAAGIAMVHQHSLLVPSMSIVENVLLAQPRGAILDDAAMAQELREVMERYNLYVDLKRAAGSLSVAERQRAEIVKALNFAADLIILDEPTTVLTPQEASALFESLRRLTREGKTIILITHKLPEVMGATDNVTVLRGGRVITTKPTDESSAEDLALLMVGREVKLRLQRGTAPGAQPATPARTLLEVQGLSVTDSAGHEVVKRVALSVAPGEIVGIAAVQGNGQSELVEAIAGLQKARSGVIQLAGEEITGATARRRRELGLRYIPRERQQRGINGSAAIWENLILGQHDRAPLATRGRLRLRAIRHRCDNLIATFRIATPSMQVAAGALSGGNQQKVVIARELDESARLVIAEEPTQGVDVAAIEFIHATLLRIRAAGAGILLVSSSLDEVLDLSDRVLVMYGGRIVGALDSAEANEQVVGRLMMGIEETAGPSLPVAVKSVRSEG